MHHASRFLPQAPASATPTFRVVILHDDLLTGRRGILVANGIVGEMGVGHECEMKLWNIGLLDTLFGRVAAFEASVADIVIVALRDSAGFSFDLKVWLRRWLEQKKHSSAALIAVFENNDETATMEARAFVEHAACRAGKEFFSQIADADSGDDMAGDSPHEFLWVL
jgi:hypothetical protein